MTSGTDKIKAAFQAAEDIDLPEDLMPEDDDARATPPPQEGGGPPPDEVVGATLPLNDTGNGKRLSHYHGESLRFVPRVGWFIWDGRRWVPDDDKITIRRMARTIQDRIQAEIPFLVLKKSEVAMVERQQWIERRLGDLTPRPADMDAAEHEKDVAKLKSERADLRKVLWGRGSTRQRHMTFAKAAGNTGSIDHMIEESTVDLARPVDHLDSDPLTVNTDAGLLRFTVDGGPGTGVSRTAAFCLHPHAREVAVPGRTAPQLVTKMMPVVYDPGAKCPLFDAFLARIQPKADMRAFLQRWFGLSMTGIKIQKFAFFYGDGANGKSVLVDLMARLLDGYAHSAKIESFTGEHRRKGSDATPDIFPLIWARMVRASEPEDGVRLMEGLIKELTGGEPILVRKLHGDFIQAEPFFKLTVQGNHKPDIRGTDDGIWRRVLLVPFGEKIPEPERDPDLIEKLWAERPGILNWLVDGLVDFLEGGLQEPDAVIEATSEYRADSDPVGQFLDGACVITGDAADKIDSADLGRALNLWLALNGLSMWTPNTCGRRLMDRAGKHRGQTGQTYDRIKSGVKKFIGIRLTREFSSIFDDAPRDAKGQPRPRTGGSAS